MNGETALSIFGARPRASGDIFVDGKPAAIRSPAEAIAAGIGYASEERKETGLFLEMTVSQNVVAARLEQFGAWWFDDRRGASVAENFRERLQIATPSVTQTVRHLSGGNQQKVVLAKWLLVAPRVLMVDEPTRGIDVGAKSEVHKLLRDVARKGTAVIVISSDLPEVLAIADRILVMRRGRLVAELDAKSATQEEVLTHAAVADVERPELEESSVALK